MARDFTYIDDVTSGVMAAMQYEPTRCGHVFNIGRGRPVVVRQMIAMLETELNVTANIVIQHVIFIHFIEPLKLLVYYIGSRSVQFC